MERQGQREAIDRMTKHLVEHGRGNVSHEAARETARKAAIRSDQRHNGERK